MNIHEHQAKQILKDFGAPIAKGAAITAIDQAEAAVASLPGPVWVVKSQIHAGGRGKGKFKELAANSKAVCVYLFRLRRHWKISVKCLARH